MSKFGLAQPVRRVEDPRLLKGEGRYTDDIALPGMLHGVVLRSPHAAARIIDRHRSGEGRARRRRGLYQRRAQGRRHRLGALHRAAEEPRRHEARRPAASRAGRRTRSATSATPWRSSSPKPTRPARDAAEVIHVDYDILPSAHRPRHRHGPGRAAGLAGRAEQRRVRLGDRRQGEDRGAVRQGRARDPADHRQQPHRRQLDGGARGARRIRQRDRTLDAVRQHPRRLAASRTCSAPRSSKCRAGQVPRHHPRCRRRLRHEAVPLRRTRARPATPRASSAAR